jgi:hypothetical protein
VAASSKKTGGDPALPPKELIEPLPESAGASRAADNAIQRDSLVAGRPDTNARHTLIAEAAYHRAARRGFEPGAELDDWLAAEREVDEASGRAG